MNLKDLSKVVVSLVKAGSTEAICDIDIDEIMSLDVENVEMEYDKITTLYGIVSVMVAYAHMNEMVSKFKLECLVAKLDLELREKLGKEKDKVTERLIENSIKVDERYIACYNEWLEMRKQYMILKQLENALIVKKDILISFAADKRLENE